MQTQERISQEGHGSMPEQVPAWDLVPLAPNARGFVGRLPAVTKEERASIALPVMRAAAAPKHVALTAREQYPLHSMAEAAATKFLLEAIEKLEQVQRAAEAADYGDQFTGSVDEAIKQIKYTLGMLA